MKINAEVGLHFYISSFYWNSGRWQTSGSFKTWISNKQFLD